MNFLLTCFVLSMHVSHTVNTPTVQTNYTPTIFVRGVAYDSLQSEHLSERIVVHFQSLNIFYLVSMYIKWSQIALR